MKRSLFKKLTFESKFDRMFACFMNNHNGTAKVKRDNRREARTKLKEKLRRDWEDYNEDCD